LTPHCFSILSLHPPRVHLPLPSFPTRRSSDLFAFSLKLFNTFSGLLIMPHAPFLIICIEERLSPFAMWTAFPSSDYYVDSVAISSEEHTSELQSRFDLACRLLLDNKQPLAVHR